MADRDFLIPMSRFDNQEDIELRVAQSQRNVRGSLRTALKYLYLSDGPVNLPRDRLKAAEQYLEPAERILARWLQTRTNGRERRNYGAPALRAARLQRYRCEHCGAGDVRVLHLDHVEGRARSTQFACLCANCHNIKSRAHEWRGNR